MSGLVQSFGVLFESLHTSYTIKSVLSVTVCTLLMLEWSAVPLSSFIHKLLVVVDI